MKLFEPLYSESRGLAGFACLAPRLDDPEKTCGRILKTETGIVRHLKSKHHLELQLPLPLTSQSTHVL